jgi:ATP-binding cassette subfamily B protein RaxB
MKIFYPVVRQRGMNDCGLACIQMIANYLHINHSLKLKIPQFKLTKSGLPLLDIKECLEGWGLNIVVAEISVRQIIEIAKHGAIFILHLTNNHYVILYEILEHNESDLLFRIANPSNGMKLLTLQQFTQSWIISESNNRGIAVIIKSNYES